MVPVLTVGLVVAGTLATALLVRSARRAVVTDRLRRGGTTRWRVHHRLRPVMSRALEDADIARTPEEAIELWGIGVLAAVVLTLAVAPGMLVLALLAATASGPAWVWFARERRERRFARALPGVLEQVASELRGGGTVPNAVARLAASESLVAADLRRVRTRTELGLSLVDALAGWPVEHDAPGVRAAAGAFAVAATLGGRAADAIDGLASSLRQRLDAVDDARALSSQARLSAVVVGAAPVGYLVFSSLVDPHAATVLVGTGVGRVCLALGLGLEASAALWIRRIVRAEV
jgi:tight adherence protein B